MNLLILTDLRTSDLVKLSKQDTTRKVKEIAQPLIQEMRGFFIYKKIVACYYEIRLSSLDTIKLIYYVSNFYYLSRVIISLDWQGDTVTLCDGFSFCLKIICERF